MLSLLGLKVTLAQCRAYTYEQGGQKGMHSYVPYPRLRSVPEILSGGALELLPVDAPGGPVSVILVPVVNLFLTIVEGRVTCGFPTTRFQM